MTLLINRIPNWKFSHDKNLQSTLSMHELHYDEFGFAFSGETVFDADTFIFFQSKYDNNYYRARIKKAGIRDSMTKIDTLPNILKEL